MAFDREAGTDVSANGTILLIGGDRRERARFADLFSREGFSILQSDTPDDAGTRHHLGSADLVLLDDRSCGARAIGFCRSSAVEGGAPVILLSDRADVVSRIVALEVGADEVLPAEIDGRLLVAQARALLRRCRVSAASDTTRSNPGGWSLDAEARVATGPNGLQTALADHQVRLMRIFLAHPGVVISAERLAQEDPSLRMEAAAFRTAISRLRRRLAPLHDREFVQIVRGRGYLHKPG